MIYQGKNVTINEPSCIGKNVILEDDVYIDAGVIIRDNVHIKQGSYIGSQSILGEYTADLLKNRKADNPILVIGEEAVIRSQCIIYGGTEIGEACQTGHGAVIREHNKLGHHVRIGTHCEIQHNCRIGNYVCLHSKVFLGEETELEDFVWLFPGVTVTNDPTPPSNTIDKVRICKFASVGARAVLMPGITVGNGSLIGAGSVVTKDVSEGMVVLGNPARVTGQTVDIKNKKTGEKAYPWPCYFNRNMPWEGQNYDEWIKCNNR